MTAPSRELAVHVDVPLAPRSSLGVGGAARWFTTATTVDDLAAAHAWSRSRGEPLTVWGGGTNVVVADRGLEGLVVAIALRGTAFDTDGDDLVVTAASGEPWDAVVQTTVDRGYAGLECLSGIPGLVGGTPIQNVGAYGQDVARVLERVTVFDAHAGGTRQLTAPECGFGYRTSRFKGADAGQFVVCDVTFRLRRSSATTSYPDIGAELRRRGRDQADVADVRAAVLEVRRRKGMVIDPADPDTRSVGSFFTNPIVSGAVAARISDEAGVAIPAYAQPGGGVRIPAAWLIERAGWAKGHADGGAGISAKHPLAIVNRGGATAVEVVRLAGRIARSVHERFGVRLRAEPVFMGFGGDCDVAYLQGADD